jgi:high-affinity iron transporter
MFAALVIVLREVIEAGLIVGIVLAVTRPVAHARRWIAGGVAFGIAGSLLVAMFTTALASALSGMGQEYFNATILTVAVVMLSWHNIWMTSHGRQLAGELKATGAEVASGARSVAALAIVVGVAVLREGSEVVLFLYGIIVSGGETPWSLFVGGLAGLALGAGFTALTYLGLVHIPVRYLFAVTSALIAFLAAGMAAQAVAFLEQAGAITVLGKTVWNTSWLLPQTSLFGRVLHTLVGYMDRPSEIELLVYLTTLAVIFGLSRVANTRAAQQQVHSA